MQSDYLIRAYTGPREGSDQYNKCDLCNLKNGATKHTPGACCIVCRNFELVDAAAARYKLDNIRSTKVNPEAVSNADITIDQYLRRTEAAEQGLIDARQKSLPLQKEFITAATALSEAQKIPSDGKNSEQRAEKLKVLTEKMNMAEKAFDEQRIKSLDTKMLDEDVRRIIVTITRQLLLTVQADMVQFGTQGRAYWSTLDATDRARFIYVWIARSLRYDAAIKSRHTQARTACNTLRGGFEICGGFADLFKIMFDDSQNLSMDPKSIAMPNTAPETLSTRLGGTAAAALGDNSPEDHAWNSFPVPVQGGQIEWKVVDLTSAAGQADHLAGVAFEMPNAKYRETHTVKGLNNQYEILDTALVEKAYPEIAKKIGWKDSPAVNCHQMSQDSGALIAVKWWRK